MHVIEPDALLLRVLESGKPDARKWHCIKSVGKYVSMRMFPVWRNGVVAGAFSIFRDVTELNRLGMEVERITQVAEELTSQLDVELSRFQMIGQDPQFRTHFVPCCHRRQNRTRRCLFGGKMVWARRALQS